MRFIFTIYALLCSFLQLVAQEEEASVPSTFPKEISFDYEGKHYDLNLTGVAVRKKFFVKVYNIASYLQKGSYHSSEEVLDAILNGNKVKQVTMRWLRNVPLQQFQNGFEESLHKVIAPEEMESFSKDIDTFLSFFNVDANRGDEFVFRGFPDGTVEVLVGGQKMGTLRNPQFTKKLWEIWFGANSVVNRNDLISSMLN